MNQIVFIAIACLFVITTAEKTQVPDVKEIATLGQDDFASEALMAHNLYRRIHGVAPLKLNAKLVDLAVSRAKELAQEGKLNVKQILFHGENLGETVGTVNGFSSYNGISATQLWYSVVSKFDEEGETSNEGASFTQMVWKKTQEVGFGIAKSKEGKFFFVAEYFPSGNIRGQYEDNVFQLTDEELIKCLSLNEKSTTPIVPVVHKETEMDEETTSTVKSTTALPKTTPSDEVVLENKKLKSKLPVVSETTTRIVKVSTESVDHQRTKEEESSPVKFKVTEVVDLEKTRPVDEETTTTERPIKITSTRQSKFETEPITIRVRTTTIIATTANAEPVAVEEVAVVETTKPARTTTTTTTTVEPRKNLDADETTTRKSTTKPTEVESTTTTATTTRLVRTSTPADILIESETSLVEPVAVETTTKMFRLKPKIERVESEVEIHRPSKIRPVEIVESAHKTTTQPPAPTTTTTTTTSTRPVVKSTTTTTINPENLITPPPVVIENDEEPEVSTTTRRTSKIPSTTTTTTATTTTEQIVMQTTVKPERVELETLEEATTTKRVPTTASSVVKGKEEEDDIDRVVVTTSRPKETTRVSTVVVVESDEERVIEKTSTKKAGSLQLIKSRSSTTERATVVSDDVSSTTVAATTSRVSTESLSELAQETKPKKTQSVGKERIVGEKSDN